MAISLTPDLDEELDAVMRQGHYANAEEALRHAIHLLQEEQMLR